MTLTNAMDVISQVAITVMGIVALVLISKKNKWGFVVGLLSQPFWFATAIINHQVGIIILSAIYTITWSYGIYLWFFKKGGQT